MVPGVVREFVGAEGATGLGCGEGMVGTLGVVVLEGVADLGCG